MKVKLMFNKNNLNKGDIRKVIKIFKCSSYNEDQDKNKDGYDCCKKCGGKRVILEVELIYNDCWGDINKGFALSPVKNTLRSFVED